MMSGRSVWNGIEKIVFWADDRELNGKQALIEVKHEHALTSCTVSTQQ